MTGSGDGVEQGHERMIKTALISVPYTGRHLEQLRAALAPAEVLEVPRHDREGVLQALERADVAIVQGAIDEHFLSSPQLAWVHCDASGIESSAWPEVFEQGLLVTGSAGRSAPVLAEHVFFLVLSLVYDAPALDVAQREHRWGGIPGYESRTGLYGKTMGIIGLGATGRAVAERAKSFGMEVFAYRRSASAPPACVDRLFCTERGEGIGELLERSDVVVLATRLSDETYHMIGESELAKMKSTAYLVNMARGAVIDEEVLVAALAAGSIAGAGLDTFVQEPLPADHPLWDLPNVVITPHMTPEMQDFHGQSLAIICENIRRYRRGEPLLNALVNSDVYTKNR